VIGDILQPTHLLFVLVVALLFLGPKRLPEVGRSLGRGGDDPEPREEVAMHTAAATQTPVPEPATTTPTPVQQPAHPASPLPVDVTTPADAAAPTTTPVAEEAERVG
jgi:sec-independent protein translocase protein TatA